MEHIPSPGVDWEPAPAENFTGRVWFGPLSQPDNPDGLAVLAVAFQPGARTDWHHHPGGQVLYVTSGAGFVQNDAGETVLMSEGDAVTIPPGEVHWHGATDVSPMTHLSLTSHGVTQWTDRKVNDDEYRRAVDHG